MIQCKMINNINDIKPKSTLNLAINKKLLQYRNKVKRGSSINAASRV